jgi:fatty acid desaturase
MSSVIREGAWPFKEKRLTQQRLRDLVLFHMITKEELKELYQISGWQSIKAIAVDWLGIVALSAIALYFMHPVVTFVCMILVARYQLALAILMHDASHKRLFQSEKLNDYVGQIFLSSPLFFSLESYRILHLKHHQNPLAVDDPDLPLIGGYPITHESLWRKLARDFFGVSYFKFIRYFLFAPRKVRQSGVDGQKMKVSRHKKMPLYELLFWNFLMNGVIFSGFYFSGHPWMYVILWYVPMVTILQVLLRIRGITEHAGYAPNKDQRQNARTVINPLQTFFFAPHDVNYHIEHHVYPAIPFYNLSKAHKIMKERGSLPEANLFYSYQDVVHSLVI